MSAARVDPGASSFGGAQLISPAGETAAVAGPPALAELGDAGAAIAYAQGTAVRAAIAPPAGPFAAPQTLEDGATPAGDLRIAGDGAHGIVAAWRRGDPASGEIRARLYDADAPTLAAATVPTTLDPGQPAAFAATVADPWTGATAVWDLGDGTTATGTSVSHAYAAGGLYPVAVRARDGAGNLSQPTERVVRVNVAAGAPGLGACASRFPSLRPSRSPSSAPHAATDRASSASRAGRRPNPCAAAHGRRPSGRFAYHGALPAPPRPRSPGASAAAH
ncbi:MAG TPA: PKD domain-containing protein [Baekduia sp.]|uniref:PKD domain-containing protein n=1 Tax=Baekduia sp. TaxID=2600305 RepID=UPI002CB24CB3|nr:PKD domain-containing protein [Baekduia sp.]HMJ33360.1 PKD domain-containing protein [Baekduia sp.]